ncbi:MAG: hypothetical protein DWH98_05525 [Planctomycetota bacterium]|nr:MAG: hypothetical protein DWH98_05525 [Planctomycetota bacterium]
MLPANKPKAAAISITASGRPRKTTASKVLDRGAVESTFTAATRKKGAPVALGNPVRRDRRNDSVQTFYQPRTCDSCEWLIA